MKFTLQGGPHDGAVIDVPDGTYEFSVLASDQMRESLAGTFDPNIPILSGCYALADDANLGGWSWMGWESWTAVTFTDPSPSPTRWRST